MKTKNNKYQKVKTKFEKHKEFYKQRIEYWQERGDSKRANEAKHLLEQIENSIRELHDMLIQSKEHNLLAKKIDHFAFLVKRIHDLTKPAWKQWVEAIVVAGLFAFVLRSFVFGLYHVPTGSAEVNILVGDRLCGNKFSYFFNDIKRGDLVIFDRPTFRFDTSNPIRYFWQKYIGIPVPFFGLHEMPDSWVKRVIALPGDVIEGRIENEKTVVYLNGKRLDEPYVNPFPLIRLKKTAGFFHIDTFGFLPVPSFLRVRSSTVNYTYDPNKSFDEQPFYTMHEDEVVYNPKTASPVLAHPQTPSYSVFGETIDKYGPYTVPEGKYWVMGDSRKNSKDSRFWGFLDRSIIHGKASFILFSIDSEESFWLFECIKNPAHFWYKSIRWNRFGKKLG